MNSNKLQRITKELQEAQQLLTSCLNDSTLLKNIEKTAALMIETIKNEKKIISCGNGGSHCDAMHFSEELTGRYKNNRKALPAIAISDPSHLSCVANDFGYEFVFSRFIEGLGKEGDLLLGISTSGNSANIINAFLAAKKQAMKTVALTGKGGGKLSKLADIEICVPHFGYADRIQEIHIKIIHILIQIIEEEISI